ncbi:hypothetical protein [Planomicrobium sp. CPCC 101079]|uniref:hypothetical protein n=1 Tax=Planomicrobium sp. CPCC 101079 TaxID=2599618 RepID=UPI0011B37078|nr:hypothetical protein [Planomicrobium sp. CPCC 101079]TWT03647.1 hypothetical protein FQV28_11550 [Planomicrobium sp. CPCC 101079]
MKLQIASWIDGKACSDLLAPTDMGICHTGCSLRIQIARKILIYSRIYLAFVLFKSGIRKKVTALFCLLKGFGVLNQKLGEIICAFMRKLLTVKKKYQSSG